jgi:hypothetical protein
MPPNAELVERLLRLHLRLIADLFERRNDLEVEMKEVRT